MQIDRPRADIAATGLSDPRAAQTRQQRAEHPERGAHAGDDLRGRFVRGEMGGVHARGAAVVRKGNRNPQVAQNIGHGGNITDTGKIVDSGNAFGGERAPAKIASEAFLEPLTGTVPERRFPPTSRLRCEMSCPRCAL